MKERNLAPVVLFTYKRLQHTKKTISFLSLSSLASKTILYIYSDAPRNDNDKEEVNAVREFLHSVTGFLKIIVIERSQNVGLTDNIINGVSDVIRRHGRVIVLEDDIIVSKYFLEYMNTALDIYKDNEKVMAISSYWWPDERDSLPEAFFVRWFNVWGWATWERSWKNFERNPIKTLREFPRAEIPKLNIGGYYNLWNQVIANVNGTLNSWAIFFILYIWNRQGLVLHPRYDLSMNIGLDGSGEHCSSYFTEKFRRKALRDWDISSFPKKIEECDIAKTELIRWFACKHYTAYQNTMNFVKFCQTAKRLYCYGAGGNGERIVHALSLHGIDIVGFIETKRDEIGELYGRPIYGIDNLDFVEQDRIIIAVQYKYQNEVVEELISRGIRSYCLLQEDMHEFLFGIDDRVWENE